MAKAKRYDKVHWNEWRMEHWNKTDWAKLFSSMSSVCTPSHSNARYTLAAHIAIARLSAESVNTYAAFCDDNSNRKSLEMAVTHFKNISNWRPTIRKNGRIIVCLEYYGRSVSGR